MTNCPAQNGKWYAIYTKSRFEKKLHLALQKSGFQTFLPLVKQKRAWSDRIKTVEVPLLPSYLFVKTTQSQFAQIYYHNGFVRFVTFERQPCVIKEKEIQLLERIIRNELPVQQSTHFGVGDSVRIIRGPLRGWEGRVACKKNKSRIVFVIGGIGQAISVEVMAGDVEVVKGHS